MNETKYLYKVYTNNEIRFQKLAHASLPFGTMLTSHTRTPRHEGTLIHYAHRLTRSSRAAAGNIVSPSYQILDPSSSARVRVHKTACAAHFCVLPRNAKTRCSRLPVDDGWARDGAAIVPGSPNLLRIERGWNVRHIFGQPDTLLGTKFLWPLRPEPPHFRGYMQFRHGG